MDFLERWLKSRPLIISLMLGFFTAFLLCGDDTVGPSAIPFGDGGLYAVRAFTLYGYLHSGQWARFWNLFTFAKDDTLAPLHYWIFFLLPQSLAGITAYGVILALTNYLLLAFGAWALCDALGRKEWSPLLFLLCSSQNISLDFFYFYFCDVPFLALGTVALAAQIRAWQKNRLSSSILSGALAALMFLVKPANAVLFAGTYVLAETIHAGLSVWQRRNGVETGNRPGQNFGQHFAGIALGFLPILLLVLACGALQTILFVIDGNEASDVFATPLLCTGLTRLFYFPLCLSYFYYAFLVIVLGVIIVAVTLKRLHRLGVLPPVEATGAFPWQHLLPVVAAYLVLGEYFSLEMHTKTMRSLLLVLPPLWLLIFWGAERFRVRLATLFFGITCYVSCAYAQIYFEIFTFSYVSPEGYQITDNWPVRFPCSIYTNQREPVFTHFVLDFIHHYYPNGGKIAIGTDQMFFKAQSLDWLENSNLLLHGRTPVYHFDSFLQPDGCLVRPAIVGANGVILYTLPSLQYSNPVFKVSYDLVIYARDQWQNRDHLATLAPLVANPNLGADGIYGYLIMFRSPATEQQITDALKAMQAPGYAIEKEQFDSQHDRRLTWGECRDVLARWLGKLFGFSQPATSTR